MTRTAIFISALWFLLSTEGARGEFDAAGTCKDGGSLSNITQPPYKGRASDLLRIAALRSNHAALVGSESPWIRDLSGPSGYNMVYRRNGLEVVVVSTCKPRSCSAETLVGLIEPRDGHYGLVIVRKGIETELGSISSHGRAALACLDERGQASAQAVQESIRSTVK